MILTASIYYLLLMYLGVIHHAQSNLRKFAMIQDRSRSSMIFVAFSRSFVNSDSSVQIRIL